VLFVFDEAKIYRWAGVGQGCSVE